MGEVQFIVSSDANTYLPSRTKGEFHYSGLSPIIQMLVDNACGGMIADKRVVEAYDILEKISQNSQQRTSHVRRGGRIDVGLRNHPNLSWSNNNHLEASNYQGSNTNYQGGNTNYQGGNNNQGYQIRGYNRFNQRGPRNINHWESFNNYPPNHFNSQAPPNQTKDTSLEEIVSTVIKMVGIGSEALKNTLHASEQRMTTYMQSNDQRANSHGASLKKMETQLAQIFDAMVKKKGKASSTDEHINLLEVVKLGVEEVIEEETILNQDKILDTSSEENVKSVVEVTHNEDGRSGIDFLVKLSNPGIS
ncbi:hypothetical protein LWI28_027143 [Acer negundo]|uniref:Uncharacterized protein n=1 Tax=Acer negundo TaxID=4023 RepID=A0AAD5IXD4_ACENE|nr:hypothetical protein LWI28_027143 [Acer negundo]